MIYLPPNQVLVLRVNGVRHGFSETIQSAITQAKVVAESLATNSFVQLSDTSLGSYVSVSQLNLMNDILSPLNQLNVGNPIRLELVGVVYIFTLEVQSLVNA